jgi:pimeloyl-ACP methyl ester carboxylesterase
MKRSFIEEKIVVGSGSEFPLNGLVTIPSGGSAPYPAVVFVHGSGSSDMDSKVFAVRPFKDFAEGLAKYNIASIRYDKRSFAHAKKISKVIKDFSVKEESIEDAILAANILRSDRRIDPGRVFIAGISMGGMLAPRIDAEGGNFAGLILMAAPARRLDEVVITQLNEAMSTAKFPVKWIIKQQAKKLLPVLEKLYNMSDEEAKNTPIFGGRATAFYLKDMGKKRVSEYLKDSKKPILVMQGDGDFQVSVELEFEAYKSILHNHPNASFKLYPGLNHVFMPVVHGDINKVKAEYSKPQNVDSNVIADIAAWINNLCSG